MGFGIRDRDTYPRLANLTLANLVPRTPYLVQTELCISRCTVSWIIEASELGSYLPINGRNNGAVSPLAALCSRRVAAASCVAPPSRK